jgi:anti-anti-sigma factor
LRLRRASQALSSNPCGCYLAALLSLEGEISAIIRNSHHNGRSFAGSSAGRKFDSMATPRRIKVNESKGVTIVTFNDSKIIDEAEIQEFGQELYDLVDREGRKKIILNFANVEFLSSAALGKLIKFDSRAKHQGSALILSNIRPEIYEVFAITKLTKLFVIKDDEADALVAI